MHCAWTKNLHSTHAANRPRPRRRRKAKEPTAAIRLNAWELLAIEEALRAGLPHVERTSLDALIEKIANAKVPAR